MYKEQYHRSVGAKIVSIFIGINPLIDYVSIYRVMVYFWILFGLAVAAAVIGFLTELWMKAGEFHARCICIFKTSCVKFVPFIAFIDVQTP